MAARSGTARLARIVAPVVIVIEDRREVSFAPWFVGPNGGGGAYDHVAQSFFVG